MKFDKFTALVLTSLFSFIAALHWFAFYIFESKVGGFFVQGSNLVANRHPEIDRAVANRIFALFLNDLAEYSPSFWQWTIGNGRFYPLFIAAGLGVLGILLLLSAFRSLAAKKDSSSLIEAGRDV